MHIIYLNTACSLLFLFYWNGQEKMHYPFKQEV